MVVLFVVVTLFRFAVCLCCFLVCIAFAFCVWLIGVAYALRHPLYLHLCLIATTVLRQHVA